MIDQESKSYLSKELSRLVAEQVDGLVTGSFPNLAALERQRGVIVGLGLALDLISGKPQQPPTEMQSGEEQDVDTTEE